MKKKRHVSLILLPLQNITFDLASSHQTLSACPSKILTTQRMHQAGDQRAPLVYTWLLGQLCAVPLLELALMSSEQPAAGRGRPVIGDMR